MTNQPYKICPACTTPAPLDALYCARCRHAYRTKFTPPPPIDQTQAFNVPQPQPYYPPQPYPYYPPVPPSGYVRVAPGSHSIVMAVLLSLFCLVCGGQLYNRQYGKALVLLLVAVVCGAMTLGLSALITAPIAVIDAGVVASRLNRGEMVSVWQWF